MINDQRSFTLNSPPVAHFSLTSTETLTLVDLEDETELK